MRSLVDENEMIIYIGATVDIEFMPSFKVTGILRSRIEDSKTIYNESYC